MDGWNTLTVLEHLGTLCSCSPEDLRGVRGVGRKSVGEIRELLALQGLALGSDYSALGYRNPLTRMSVEDELDLTATEEERLETLLSVKIDRLEPSVMLYNVLKAHEIYNLGTLCSCDRRDLGRCRNLGRKALAEADGLLARFGPQDGAPAATDRKTE